MKKIIALALTVLIALSCLTACGKAPSGTEAGKEIKVGICNYVDDASLNQIVRLFFSLCFFSLCFSPEKKRERRPLLIPRPRCCPWEI